MPDVALRARFPLGCRVRFAALARQRFQLRRDVPATVVGYGKEGPTVRLVRDGNRARETWHVQFLERLEDAAHA